MTSAQSRTTDETSPRQDAVVSPAKGSIPAIRKASAVLDVLAASDRPLTFGEIAGRVTMAKSSLHDVCSSLVNEGLAERSEDGRYALGLRMVELARRRLAGMNLIRAFQQVCQLHGPSPETVVLSVLSGSDVVYVAFVDGTRPLAVRYEIGMRLPAAFTASGKAMLATLPDAEVRERLGSAIPDPRGGEKPIDFLMAELQQARERRFSLDDEETATGMVCFGAPIFDVNGGPAVGAAAVSLVKSATSWFDDTNSRFVRDFAAAVTTRLGGAPW